MYERGGGGWLSVGAHFLISLGSFIILHLIFILFSFVDCTVKILHGKLDFQGGLRLDQNRDNSWYFVTSVKMSISWLQFDWVQVVGKVQNMDPWSMDRVHGPPIFTSWGCTINYDLMTFDDRLRDGSSFGKPCTNLIAHLPWKFMFNSSFSLSLVILKRTGWFWKV